MSFSKVGVPRLNKIQLLVKYNYNDKQRWRFKNLNNMFQKLDKFFIIIYEKE